MKKMTIMLRSFTALVAAGIGASAFAEAESRNHDEKLPMYGLSSEDFYKTYSYVIVSDHSFRKEPALQLLKKCFGMEQKGE